MNNSAELVAALPNMAYKKTAFASIGTNSYNTERYSVDGLLSTPLIALIDDTHSWWAVDLDRRYRVAEVHFITTKTSGK